MQNKFHSSLKMTSNYINSILHTKIHEEKQKAIHNHSKDNIKYEHQLYKDIHINPKLINVDSLFSGAGGSDLGLELAGIALKYGRSEVRRSFTSKNTFIADQHLINILYSNDNYETANDTYKHNFQGSYIKDPRDIRKVIQFPKCDLIIGSFPCPGFSSAGPRLIDDPRNFLYVHYLRALDDAHPVAFVAENVKGLLTMAKGRVIHQMIQDFASTGYQLIYKLLDAKYYGVPQDRQRVFIIGIRNDVAKRYKYYFPKVITGTKRHPFITLKDAISDLPKDPSNVYKGSYSSQYMSRNRKKSWNDQSYTIQASGRQAPQAPYGLPMTKISRDRWKFNGSFNRRLSVRECARIQTFPDWFQFCEGNSRDQKNTRLNQAYKQIGNAVPVLLAEHVCLNLLRIVCNVKHLNI